ncbi:MAG: sigma-70 family RNA polymerase sigma factor [Bacteroidaceae bacterium]|nr:sigma-70 family RNA polymerase sigma factor [Bacteroidaceae bacterium]
MQAEKFTSIVSCLRPRLLSLALQFNTDFDAAEDAVQEALMRLWTAWEGLPDTADAERLAIRLTKHACIDAYRRRQQQQMVELKDNSATTTDNTIQEEELQYALERAVSALPPAAHRLWTLFAEAQMDSAQIAATTGITVRSVSTMLSAARRHIIESLKKGGAL